VQYASANPNNTIPSLYNTPNTYLSTLARWRSPKVQRPYSYSIVPTPGGCSQNQKTVSDEIPHNTSLETRVIFFRSLLRPPSTNISYYKLHKTPHFPAPHKPHHSQEASVNWFASYVLVWCRMVTSTVARRRGEVGRGRRCFSVAPNNHLFLSYTPQ